MDIEAIRARLAAATPGPWFVEDEQTSKRGKPIVTVYARGAGVVCRTGPIDCPNVREDAALIAHAPADLAALLAAHDAQAAQLAAAQAEAARLRAALEALHGNLVQSNDDPEFWLVHVTDFNAAGRALDAPSPDAERGAALLAVVEAARKIAAADGLAQMLDWQDELDSALRRYDEGGQ